MSGMCASGLNGAVIGRWWPLLMMPIMAFLSFLWSDYPDVAGRYGFQLLLTAAIGVLIARRLTPERFAVTLFIGMLIFCVASIVNGRQGPSAEGMVLIGLTGSKNAMAMAANMLVASSIAVLFLPGLKMTLRWLAIVGLAIGIYVVAVASSATAVLMAVGSAGMFCMMCVMQKLPPSGRASVILGSLAVLIPIFFLQNEINDAIATFMRDVLHKDPTLTGRTYLWERADDLISRRPLLGYGFQAIWLSDNPDTLGILRWAGQTDGRVFNFHSTYRQIGVDLGLVGAGVLVLTILAVVVCGVRQFIVAPSVATSFAFTFFILLVSKTFTEVIMVTFSAQTLLFYACATYAFYDTTRGAQSRLAPQQQRPAQSAMRPLNS